MEHELESSPHWAWLVALATSLLVGWLTLSERVPELQSPPRPAPVATASAEPVWPAPDVDPSLPPAPPPPTF
jgi:hypothetical protein